MEDVGRESFGKNARPYHLKTFGHPSEKGFKDVANQWKAEKLDTDNLLKYFTEDLGAKYFMALAHHHDNFDNWNSTHHEWNSVNVGIQSLNFAKNYFSRRPIARIDANFSLRDKSHKRLFIRDH